MRTMATLERSTAACSGRTKDGDQADHEHRHICDVSSSSTTRRNCRGEGGEEEVKVNIHVEYTRDHRVAFILAKLQ